jgi:hypothetical protein
MDFFVKKKRQTTLFPKGENLITDRNLHPLADYVNHFWN